MSICETCTGNDQLRHVCVNGPDLQKKNRYGEVVECTGYKMCGSDEAEAVREVAGEILDPKRSYLEECKRYCWEADATIPCPEVGMIDPQKCAKRVPIMTFKPADQAPRLCRGCKHEHEYFSRCASKGDIQECKDFEFKDAEPNEKTGDAVNHPNHYAGKIEVIDYNRDKLTPEEFTGFCMGNVIKYVSRWRKKDGVQDLKKAAVYLQWAIENEEKKA